MIRDKTLNKEYDAAHMLSPMPLAITLGAASNSMRNYLLRYYVAEHGIDPDTDIQIRSVPPPEMVANLRAHSNSVLRCRIISGAGGGAVCRRNSSRHGAAVSPACNARGENRQRPAAHPRLAVERLW